MPPNSSNLPGISNCLLEEVRNRSVPEGGFVAILEVCGVNDWFLKLLAEYGCRETVLVQPEKRTKNKTDRRDAKALGELLRTNRQRLLAGKKVQDVRRIVPPAVRDAEDRQLTAVRQRLGRLRTRTIKPGAAPAAHAQFAAGMPAHRAANTRRTDWGLIIPCRVARQPSPAPLHQTRQYSTTRGARRDRRLHRCCQPIGMSPVWRH
jgi:hypothetical protein